jgi:ribosomal protein S18 acetylase RimI-like enzyme
MDPATVARFVECDEAVGIAAGVEARIARGEEGLAVAARGSIRLIDAGPDSPLTRACGIGFDGEVTDETARWIRGFFEVRGRVARAELSPWAHPSAAPALRKAGFGLDQFKDLLVRDLGEPLPAPLPGVDVREMRRDDPADVDLVARTEGRAFGEGAEPDAAALVLEKTLIEPPNVRSFLATVDGVPAGGGTLALQNGRIALFAGATLPDFRRRGVQTALLRARLACGQAHGATLASVASSPGSGTRRNAERLGFRVLFTKVSLVA